MPPAPQIQFKYTITGINMGDPTSAAKLDDTIDDAVERLRIVLSQAEPEYAITADLAGGATFVADLEVNVNNGQGTLVLTMALAGLSNADMAPGSAGLTDLTVDTGTAVNGAVNDSALDGLSLSGRLHVVSVR